MIVTDDVPDVAAVAGGVGAGVCGHAGQGCSIITRVLVPKDRVDEAAEAVMRGMEGAVGAKTVTYDLERQMDGARTLKTSEFGQAVIEHM